jgi:hypothetical protein
MMVNQWPSGYVQVSTSPQREAELIHINKSESPAMFVDVINGSINILDNFKSAG